MSKNTFGTRDEHLPATFTAAERAAYRWLWDCDLGPWVVDVLTHRVHTAHGEYDSLVVFMEAEQAGGGSDE